MASLLSSFSARLAFKQLSINKAAMAQCGGFARNYGLQHPGVMSITVMIAQYIPEDANR